MKSVKSQLRYNLGRFLNKVLILILKKKKVELILELVLN